MLALQLFSFAMEVYGDSLVMLSIANTAHLVGGAIGILLGNLKFFSWHPKVRRN
jgi:membrane associated rhomboid family serine protease